MLFISSLNFHLVQLVFQVEKFYLAFLFVHFFYAGENSLSFHLSYNILISPFLEGYFCHIQNFWLTDFFFSVSTLKMLCIISWTLLFLMKSTIILIPVLIQKKKYISFTLAVFNIFSLSSFILTFSLLKFFHL